MNVQELLTVAADLRWACEAQGLDCRPAIRVRPGGGRALQRDADGTVLALLLPPLGGRTRDDVIDDLVEGFLAANKITDPTVREALLAAVTTTE